MKYLKTFTFYFLLFILFTACKKTNTIEDELAKLPPATQEGKNTFGCLVNGKAWVAQRDDCAPFVCDPPFKLYYHSANGGYISITALMKKQNIDQEIDLLSDSILHFSFRDLKENNLLTYVRFLNVTLNRDYHRSLDTNVHYYGNVYLTKVDIPNRIVSGSFSFTLCRLNWDTIKVTNGRFDGKLY